jgi:tetratricopeptide (TPR) repeat protein
MDAETLLRQGIAALRDEKDVARGHDLLLQALRQNPQLDEGWLWLSRTIGDPAKKRQCLERALAINPDNAAARAYLQKLTAAAVAPVPPADDSRMEAWLSQAEACVKAEDIPGAVQHWAKVLDVIPDHPVALPAAVRQLTRLKYMDDARQLVWTAMQRGTRDPAVYLTAIEIAKYQKDADEVDRLRGELVRLPDVDDKLAVEAIEHFIRAEKKAQALELLNQAIERHPRSQLLLLKRANLSQDMGRKLEALDDFERAAQLGAGTKMGKEADSRLLAFAPRLTDRERGSVLLALREALGVGMLYLFMGWQDAGLNLAQMGAARWGGVGLALVGGYLLVTATSSPQQQPIARWMGGEVPPPPEPLDPLEADEHELPEETRLPMISPIFRVLIGVAGGLLLLMAFALVFSMSLGLLRSPNPEPLHILTWDEVVNAGGQ